MQWVSIYHIPNVYTLYWEKMRYGYEVPRMILLQAYLYIYSFTEQDQLQSTPHQQLCTQPNDSATVWNIYRTPIMEQLSVPLSHFFGSLQYPNIFIPL
jgi:hypothetical protein